MKKQIVKKSLAQFQPHQLSKAQTLKIKGGSDDKAEDIVIVDVITP